MEQSLVNYFKGKRYPGKELVSIYSILNSFKSNKFKQQIEEGRTFYMEGDHENYQVLKGSLVAITFSGTFFPVRSSANIQNYSGYIVIDIDHCGERLEEYKSLLKSDRYVHAVWISPSGDGLKCLIKTELSVPDHKNIYRSAVKYYNELYNLDIDTSGSDVARLCYVSYDPNLFINQEAELYNDVLIEEIVSKRKLPKEAQTLAENVVLHINKRNLKNDSFDKERLRRIYHYLKKRGLSITSTHDEWVRFAFAISNSFNYDFGYRWFLTFAQLDGQLFDEYESVKLINRCYNSRVGNSTFGTIIYLAELRGYKPKIE